MASNSYEEYEKCRLCRGKSDNVNIFDDDDVQFDAKIQFVLNIQVHKTDSSLTVCQTCKTKVDEFYDFKYLCTRTEASEIGINKKEPVFKIKQEKVDEEDISRSYNAMKPVPIMPFGPNGPTMVLPYILGPMGNCVSHMVPIGNPIPYSSLSTGLKGLPMLGHFPQASEIRTAGNKIQIKTEEVDLEGKKLTVEQKVTSSDELKDCEPSAQPNVQEDHESSEDLRAVDDIINEVLTDKEDDDSLSSAEINKEQSQGNKEAVASSTTGGEEQSSTESSGKITPPVTRARRGCKRRGSVVPTEKNKKRRSSRLTTPPKLPNDPIEQSTVKRLTRSSTGSQPRKKIIDSEASDRDFDPDDPEYTTPTPQTLKDDTSGSDSDAEAEKKKDEVQKKKESLMLYIKNNRAEKEEALKKSCPHCRITYKHWVSYDDHVKSCEAEKKVEKEKQAKEPKAKEKAEEEEKKDMKCIICLEIFKGTKALRDHMSVHQAKKTPTYECKTCHETFTDKGGLICHNALKHRCNVTEPIMKSERKKLHCVECDEHFQSSGDYICHQVLHHKKK